MISGVKEVSPNVVHYKLRILDNIADTGMIILVAEGEYAGIPYTSTYNVTAKELSEATHNIIAWKINRLTKSIRTMMEQHIVNPIIELDVIYLPDGWSTYEGPDEVVAKKRKREEELGYDRFSGAEMFDTTVQQQTLRSELL